MGGIRSWWDHRSTGQKVGLGALAALAILGTGGMAGIGPLAAGGAEGAGAGAGAAGAGAATGQTASALGSAAPLIDAPTLGGAGKAGMTVKKLATLRRFLSYGRAAGKAYSGARGLAGAVAPAPAPPAPRQAPAATPAGGPGGDQGAALMAFLQYLRSQSGGGMGDVGPDGGPASNSYLQW